MSPPNARTQLHLSRARGSGGRLRSVETSLLQANERMAGIARLHVIAIVLSLIVGIAVSIWLTVDPPTGVPARPSYLPVD
jgi:hypothetical protein